MSSESGVAGWIVRHRLSLALAVQAALLFWRLDLLPIWGDEQFTLNVLALPWKEIPAALAADIHPPLYFYLAFLWTQAPWPLEPIVALRALSAVFALASTVVLSQLWLKPLPGAWQTAFLALWVIHPAVLLYSRMARSYSLQMLAALLFLAAVWRCAREPARVTRWLAFVGAGAALLWVHYLPGLALLGGASVAISASLARRREYRGLGALAAALAAVALLYAPWLATLSLALGRVQHSEAYAVTPLAAADLAARLAFWAISFHFGESLSIWLLAGNALTLAALAALLFVAARSEGERCLPQTIPLALAVAAVLGFLATWQWVSAAFTSARLLFLLPFWLLIVISLARRRPKAGALVVAALLVSAALGAANYFQKSGFLNKGYLLPFDQIAATVISQASADDIILIDAYNADPKPLLAQLQAAGLEPIVISDEASQQKAAEAVDHAESARVWLLRSTNDVSPGNFHQNLEQRLTLTRHPSVHLFLPYDGIDQLAARALGRRQHPTHHYQATEFSASHPNSIR